MIVTVVFFIIVINQFTAYSNYTNLSMINNMANAYTQYIVDYKADDGTEVLNVYTSTVTYGNEEPTTVYNVTVKDEAVYAHTELSSNGIEMIDNGDGTYSFFAGDIQKLGALIDEYEKKGFDKTNIIGNRLINTDGVYSINTANLASGSEDSVNSAISNDVADFAFKLYIESNILGGARAAAAKVYRSEAPSSPSGPPY